MVSNKSVFLEEIVVFFNLKGEEFSVFIGWFVFYMFWLIDSWDELMPVFFGMLEGLRWLKGWLMLEEGGWLMLEEGGCRVDILLLTFNCIG